MEAVREKKRTKKRSSEGHSRFVLPSVSHLPDPLLSDEESYEELSDGIPDKTVPVDESFDILHNESVSDTETGKATETPTNQATSNLQSQNVTPGEFSPIAPPMPSEESIPIPLEDETPPENDVVPFSLPDLSELQREQAVEDNKLKENDTIEYEPHAPSAPELCDLDFYQIQQINQSILQNILDTQNHCKPSTTSVKLEPFTDQERNEFYFNPKLGMVLSFEWLSKRYFSDQYDQMMKSHLYHQLMAYMDIQSNIHNYSVDIGQLKDSFPKIRQKIWTIRTTHQTFHATQSCCLKTLSYTATYVGGSYNEKWAISFKESLTNYAETTCKKHRGSMILRDLQMLTISTVIQEIIDNSSVNPRRDELRLTLTTLFHFVAKKTATKDFKENVMHWLQRILEVFNKFALLDDQLFLMSHVLRLPTEASVQVTKAVNISQPGKQIDSDSVDDWLALLWHCLRPVWRQKTTSSSEHAPEKDTNWAIVDSEGEDVDDSKDDVKFPNEVIFLELLDRMPFCKIFEVCLKIDDQTTSSIFVSGHNLLQMIIFSSAFVGIVTEGLENYQKERYKSFLKRLAGIVKWNADLVTSLYDLYESESSPKDDMVHQRLKTEYNIFMIRVANHLFRNRSVLQYLSQLNYTHLEANTYWKLSFYIITTFPANPTDAEFHQCFRDRVKDELSFTSSMCTLSQWSAEELYFVLESLSSLAMGCGDRDQEFVEYIVQSLFQLGYVLEMIRSRCYKSVRDLLMTITGKHPKMIGLILQDCQANLSLVNKESLFLLKDLPYDNWRPSLDAMDAMRDMLESYPIDSVQYSIGKLTLSYMNWGLSEDDSQLVMGHEFHCKAAMVVLSATTKRFPHAEQYKKVALHGVVETDQEKKSIAWAWKMVTKLRIHSMDQSRVAAIQKIENNRINVIPVLKLELLPAMKSLVEDDKNPLAIYIALLMCQVGNDTGEILTRGLPMLVKLLENAPLFIICRCLELIIPLFLNSPDELIKSEDLSKVIETILADESRLKWLWSNNESEVIMEMIVNQIVDLSHFGWETVQRVTWLWIMILTKNPQWSTSNNYMNVIESILKVSATIPGLLDTCREWLYPLNLELKLKNVGSRKGFIPLNPVKFPWCSLVFIELDFNCYEQVTNVWLRIVDRMAADGKRNLNQIVKELTKDFGASELSVYKWAEFLRKLPSDSHVFTVGLAQYWRLIKECEKLTDHSSVKALREKLLQKRTPDDIGDEKLNQHNDRKVTFFNNVAHGRNTVLENSLNSRNQFILDLVYMPGLREEVKAVTGHWKLISFRQEIKRRVNYSQKCGSVPLKEKRMRILELVKSQRNPDPFTNPTKDSQVDRILKVGDLKKDFAGLLKEIHNDYEKVMHLVGTQLRLEQQLYIKKLVTFNTRQNCPVCALPKTIAVKYEELLPSNINGDENMAKLMSIALDEYHRDESVVHYFYSVLFKLRSSVKMCSDADHSKCVETLKMCLEICGKCDQKAFLDLNFMDSILAQLQHNMKLLMRRHGSVFLHEVILLIRKTPAMADLLMEVLDPNSMDDGLYYRALLFLRDVLRDDELKEKCYASMKISVRASREGITESYRISLINFIMQSLPGTRRTAGFDLLGRELFIVMLRRIDLMPHIVNHCFYHLNHQKSSSLLVILLNILGLAKDIEVLSPEFQLPMGDIHSVEHLFTPEVLEQVFEVLKELCWPEMVPNEGAFIAFFELLSHLLVQKNVFRGPKLLHERISNLYRTFVMSSLDKSSEWRTSSMFKSLQFIPGNSYLALQLQHYLSIFSQNTASNNIGFLNLELHKTYGAGMMKLPWQNMEPTVETLSDIYRELRAHNGKNDHTGIVQRNCAELVVKLQWPKELFGQLPPLSMMFFIAIRIAYELPETSLLPFYQSIEDFLWPYVDANTVYSETLDWIVFSFPQKPIVTNLTRKRKTVENAILRLLARAANVRKPLPETQWGDLKRKKLIAALVRLFAMASHLDKTSVAEAFEMILEMFSKYFESEEASEMEYFQSQITSLLDEKALYGPYLQVLRDHLGSCSNEVYLRTFLATIGNEQTATKAKLRLFETIIAENLRISLKKEDSPWKTIDQWTSVFVMKLRYDHLKDMELFLTLHLFVSCKLRLCDNDRQRTAFLDDFLNWLPNIRFDGDAQAPMQALMWSQIIASAVNLNFRGSGSELLEKAQRFLKTSLDSLNAGWGKSLFSALALRKISLQEICMGYLTYLLIKAFPELRESTTESSVKFAQQFEKDSKSSKVSNFQSKLNLYFVGGLPLVPVEKEGFNKNLASFMTLINTDSSEWFRNADRFWALHD